MTPTTESGDDGVAVELETIAGQLAAGQPVPIDLGAVLRRHGLRLAATPLKRRGVHGALVERSGQREVLIYGVRPGASLNARQRFAVAHELAHHILDQRGCVQPDRGRGYWRIEDACNRFAAALLIPDVAVRWASTSACDSADLFSRISVVVDRARVSYQAVCRRLEAHLDNWESWEIADPPVGRAEVAGVVVWNVGDLRRLDLRRPAHVPPEHSLAPLVNAAREWIPGTVLARRHGDAVWILARRSKSLLGVTSIGLRSEQLSLADLGDRQPTTPGQQAFDPVPHVVC